MPAYDAPGGRATDTTRMKSDASGQIYCNKIDLRSTRWCMTAQDGKHVVTRTAPTITADAMSRRRASQRNNDVAKIRELEQQFLLAQGIGFGLSSALAALIVEHVKLLGGDPEQALKKARSVLDKSVKEIKVTGETPEGTRIDRSEDMQARVSRMLDASDELARQQLGLPLPSNRSH